MTSSKRASSRPIISALFAGLIGVFTLTAAACSEPTPQPTKATQEAGMKTVLIPIEGMACMSCAAKVTKAIESLKGVSDAEVNLADRNARVQFAPNEIAVSQIAAAVNGLGYKAGAPVEAK